MKIVIKAMSVVYFKGEALWWEVVRCLREVVTRAGRRPVGACVGWVGLTYALSAGSFCGCCLVIFHGWNWVSRGDGRRPLGTLREES